MCYADGIMMSECEPYDNFLRIMLVAVDGKSDKSVVICEGGVLFG